MLDFRVKKPSEALNWRYQEIIVTEEYLLEHADDPNLITLDNRYELGKKVLDVFLNGDRLVEGGGYEEVDDLHIKLDIRSYDNEGNQIPATLQVGDEIVIKEWFNSTSILYSSVGLNNRLTELEIEVRKARNYSDDNTEFSDLRSRLNFMQDEIDLIKRGSHGTGGGTVSQKMLPLLYNAEIIYTEDPVTKNIIREESTGDFPYVKTLVYDPISNKVLTEVTVFEGKSYVCNYEYNESGDKIREQGDRVEWLATHTLHNYLKPTMHYVSKEYRLDDQGNLLEEVSEGDVAYVKTYKYTDGRVTREILQVFGETYEKEYVYENGVLAREEGYSMKLVSVYGRAFCSLYLKNVTYRVNSEGNITKQDVTGNFTYLIEYDYLEGRVVTETFTIEGTEHVKSYTYLPNTIIESGTFAVEYGDKTDVAYTLAGTIGKSLGYMVGEGDYEIEYVYDSEGNIAKETMVGDYRIEKEFSYNPDGKIKQEVIRRDGTVTVREYLYNSQGRLAKVVAETLR